MIGIDTNILLDLMVSSTENHVKSTKEVKNLNDYLCITPTNVGECLRLLTHRKVFSKPLGLKQACEQFTSLMEFYDIQILEEPTDWWESLFELNQELPDLRGNEIFNARIALCLKGHGVKKILTRDSDFRKYRFLKPVFPLA